MTLEERIAQLEKEVAELKGQVSAQPMLPRKVDTLDYYELREQIYNWFKDRDISIMDAEKVLKCLNYDLRLQKCSGLNVRNG